MSYTWGYIKDASLAKLDLDEQEATVQNLISRFPFYANEVITQVSSTCKPKHSFAEFVITKDMLFKTFKMPNDFVSFDDDVNTIKWTDAYGDTWLEECHDDQFSYVGDNEVQFFTEGTFKISYNARWFTFTKDLDDNVVLDIPIDILECIPSYIAHQCYKIDDEVKSAIFRNEFEMFFARIDDTHFKTPKSIKIRGNW